MKYPYDKKYCKHELPILMRTDPTHNYYKCFACGTVLKEVKQ